MKKKGKSSSTLTFFMQAAFGFVKDQFRWLAVTGALAVFGGSVVPKFIHQKTPSPEVLIEEPNSNSEASKEDQGGSRSPSSIDKPIEEKQKPLSRTSSAGNLRSDDNSYYNPPSNPASTQNSPQYANPNSGYRNYGGNQGGFANNPSQNNSNSGSNSASDSAAAGDQGGVTTLGGSFGSPSPPQIGGGGVGATSGSSGGTSTTSHAPSIPVAAGSQIVAGGGIFTTPHCQTRASVGGAISANIQTMPGVMNISGIEGIYQQ